MGTATSSSTSNAAAASALPQKAPSTLLAATCQPAPATPPAEAQAKQQRNPTTHVPRDAARNDTDTYASGRARLAVAGGTTLMGGGFALARKLLPPSLSKGPLWGVYLALSLPTAALDHWTQKSVAAGAKQQHGWQSTAFALARCLQGAAIGVTAQMFVSVAGIYVGAAQACLLGAGLGVAAYALASLLGGHTNGKKVLARTLSFMGTESGPLTNSAALLTLVVGLAYFGAAVTGSTCVAIYTAWFGIANGLQAGAKEKEHHPYITAAKTGAAAVGCSFAGLTFMLPPTLSVRGGPPVTPRSRLPRWC